MAKQRAQKDRSWRKLTRRNLRMFDDSATNAVLYAMERGAVGRLSSNGHCLLRSPYGRIMAVTRNSARSKQVVAINVRRIFGD